MQSNRLSLRTYHAWLMLGIGLLASVFVGLQVKQGIERDEARRFEFTSAKVALRIQERLGAHALILQGGAGLFAGSSSVDRHDWRAYVKKLNAHESVPGVQGIGFSRIISPHQLAAHVDSVRAEGFLEYTVRPAGERAVYTSIIYLEPFEGRNLRAFGFDMFSEPVRRNAMERARDTGKAALSGKVELVQETDNEVQAGTLMYVPVYRNGAAVDTVEQRRSALIGWAYSPYRMHDLMEGVLAHWTTNEGKAVNLHVYDGPEAKADSLLFDSHPSSTRVPDADSLFYQQRIIEFNGSQWLLVFDATAGTAAISYAGVWTTLIGGFAVSGLLCALMLSVVNTRARARVIADTLTEEIRARESSLQESDNRFRNLLKSVPTVAVQGYAEDGTARYWNQASERLYGYSADEAIGRNLLDLIIPAEMHEGVREAMREMFETASPIPAGELSLLRKDGSRVDVIASHAYVQVPGQPPEMFCMDIDITERKQAEARLLESETKYRQLVENTHDIIYSLTPEGLFTYVSPAWTILLGHPVADVVGHLSTEFIHPDDQSACLAFLQKVLETGQQQEGVEYRVQHISGEWRWHTSSASPAKNPDGLVIGYEGIARDITARKQADQALQLAASVFSTAREGIMITDADGTIVSANDAFTRITGYSRDEVIGKNPRILSSGRHGPELYAGMWRDLDEKGHWQGEIWNRRKNGEVYAEMQTITTVRDAEGNARHYVSLFSDITSIKEYQNELEHIAHYDALTSLPNRVLLADRLHQAMAQARRRERVLAVVFLDLDGFKAINDQHGHQVGDALLIALSARMKGDLREGDTLARIGGDEFVAVLVDLSAIADSVPMLSRLLAVVAEPVHIGDLTVQVSASLGVTFYPQEEGIDADQLQRQADQAMYQAKLAGKNRYHVFDAAQDRSVRGNYESIERIRRALAEHEFTLYYQPKVNMRSGAVVGAEALIRWQHPQKGLLAPAAFLPVIEDHPLAIEIGEWVIESALTQMETWRAAGLELPISVNVGARQLQQPDFVERLHTLLMAHPAFRPGDLEIEVLETSALEDVTRVSLVIEACGELGVAFALDDFGTGYSSLTYLKRLAVTVLKIDKSFVRDMLDDPDDLAILEGVIGLAAAFRRTAIAEGVETVEHGEMLLQLGCDLAQGYGIAHPMPADQMPAWSATWRSPPAWANFQQVSHDNLPLLHAAVEHRAWIMAAEHYIKGERAAPPPLDPHHCRFGLWLEAERQSGRDTQLGLIAIETLHQQAHTLADELCKLRTDGRATEAVARLGELFGLRDALLGQMKALEASAAS